MDGSASIKPKIAEGGSGAWQKIGNFCRYTKPTPRRMFAFFPRTLAQRPTTEAPMYSTICTSGIYDGGRASGVTSAQGSARKNYNGSSPHTRSDQAYQIPGNGQRQCSLLTRVTYLLQTRGAVIWLPTAASRTSITCEQGHPRQITADMID